MRQYELLLLYPICGKSTELLARARWGLERRGASYDEMRPYTAKTCTSMNVPTSSNVSLSNSKSNSSHILFPATTFSAVIHPEQTRNFEFSGIHGTSTVRLPSPTNFLSCPLIGLGILGTSMCHHCSIKDHPTALVSVNLSLPHRVHLHWYIAGSIMKRD